MKKNIMMLLLAGCLTFSLAACNNTTKETETKEETTDDSADSDESAGTDEESSDNTGSTDDSEEVEKDNTPITDETVADAGIDAFLTLGEYKGIDLTKTLYTVTDEDVDELVQSALAAAPAELTDAEATVAEGDIANIDYEGTIDGTAFDGGTGEGTDLTIGSGMFVDGFEDQLIGWKAGDSGDVNVTFSEDYQNAEYAGKDAVFHVTVNKISRILDAPTDEWLAANTEAASIDEYRASLKQQQEETNTATTEQTLEDDAWNTVFATAKFIQYPQDLLDTCVAQQKTSYESYAQMYGMEYDAFIEATGITEDDLTEAAKNSVQNTLVLDYICDKEGITEESEVYQTTLTELLTQSGLASKEEAVEQGISEWNIDFVVKYQIAINLIMDNANVTEVQAEATTE